MPVRFGIAQFVSCLIRLQNYRTPQSHASTTNYRAHKIMHKFIALECIRLYTPACILQQNVRHVTVSSRASFVVTDSVNKWMLESDKTAAAEPSEYYSYAVCAESGISKNLPNSVFGNEIYICTVCWLRTPSLRHRLYPWILGIERVSRETAV